MRLENERKENSKLQNQIIKQQEDINEKDQSIRKMKCELAAKKKEREDSSVSKLSKAAELGTMTTGGVVGGMAGGMAGVIAGQSILGLYVDKSKEGEARRSMIIDNAQHVWDVSQLILGNVKSSMKNTYDSTIEFPFDNSSTKVNSIWKEWLKLFFL